MRELAERAYFALCLLLGRLLRSAKYSTARIVCEDRARHVRKHRLFYAPLAVWISGSLVKILDTGVRILPQRDWEARERHIYWRLRGTPIQVAGSGALILPCLSGQTLATSLENPDLHESARKRAIEWAVGALADLHHHGLTHGDAMAENVLVDFDAGVAHWLDFETIHDPTRPIAWRRADDVRALLVTCLVRTAPGERARILHHILDVYADEDVTPFLAATFTSLLRRPLAFHLAQAGLSFEAFREIARLLRVRLARMAVSAGRAGRTPPG